MTISNILNLTKSQVYLKVQITQIQVTTRVNLNSEIFFAYVVAFIAYIVAGFILAIIFDWMDGGDKSTDFNIIFAICFGVFMLWTTRKDI